MHHRLPLHHIAASAASSSAGEPKRLGPCTLSWIWLDRTRITVWSDRESQGTELPPRSTGSLIDPHTTTPYSILRARRNFTSSLSYAHTVSPPHAPLQESTGMVAMYPPNLGYVSPKCIRRILLYFLCIRSEIGIDVYRRWCEEAAQVHKKKEGEEISWSRKERKS